MRQKLIISENERSIILNMHKNAIKKYESVLVHSVRG
jgi:hypothetical protein